ncbi:CheR family methyltransferase [Tabrizicola sp.]|uniref:CheR family methyltransferase n=1 Tax=Tabrizicola sp. TaxID=2005166 RepID=UPI002AC9A257|nr:CheR family methyltransferase [Tabrizicola sp.]
MSHHSVSGMTDDAPRFERFSRMVQDSIGVQLPASKKVMVESRLRRRITELGLRSVDEYFRHLFDNGGLTNELDSIFDAVTTNKTDFFREAEHFIHLTERIIPARLSRRQATGRSSMFKVWSAAASTGAEAYTAAMVLADRESRRGAFEWRILGTDINRKVLVEAKRAVYSDMIVQPVPTGFRERFLMRGQGQQKGNWRVIPDLRRRVNFQKMNLMDNHYPVDRDLDVIFLRNVLIYFSEADQARVINQLSGHLAHHGHLIVGHAEGMVVRHPSLRQVGPAVYRKEQ